MTQTGLQKSELDSGDRKESKLALRISAWTGVLAFPVFFVALMIIGSLRPGYSPISQHGSDLGVGWWGAWIFNTTLTVYGVILLVFVAGFSRQIVSKVPRKRSILVTVLLTLAAIGGVLAGLFSEAYPQIHALGGVLIFGLPPVAQLLLGSRLKMVSGFQQFGKYSWISGIANLINVVFSTFYPVLKFVPLTLPLVIALDTQVSGLYQRVQMITTWGWFTVSGMMMRKLKPC